MKIIVPVNICIRQYYRGCVVVDENADTETICEEMRKSILEDHSDIVLIPDPDMDIEEGDIESMIPQMDESWTEEEGAEMAAILNEIMKMKEAQKNVQHRRQS